MHPCFYFVIRIQSVFLIIILIKYNELQYVYIDMQHALWDPFYGPHSYFQWSLTRMPFSMVEFFDSFGESSHFADVRLIDWAVFKDFS